MKAILKYPGGKWRIAQWILSYFPTHKVYLEPFFGSGAVFFNKEPSYIETINDMNGDIVNLFRVCREYPEELAKVIELTPFSRDEFISCNALSDDPIEQARRTLVRYHQSFGTSNSSKNSWRNVQTYGGPHLLKESKSLVILSGYDNDLYNSGLSDWYTAEKVTIAQMGLHRTEKLWMNFQPEIKELI